eukprot:gene8009-biopygen580
MELNRGNEFKTRVWPIFPHSKVLIVMSYSLPLPFRGGVRSLTLPLTGLPLMAYYSLFVFAESEDGISPTQSGAGAVSFSRCGGGWCHSDTRVQYLPPPV